MKLKNQERNKKLGRKSPKKISQDLPEKSQAEFGQLSDSSRMELILSFLKKEYPHSKCSLYYQTPYQLLIATILSAQCTDERVNQVTPVLFAKYPGPREMAQADLSAIEKIIQSTGFFRSKAKSILETSHALLERHQGEVPADRDALVQMRGVGRKTANVVLGVAFGVPAVVVDTHVGRLSRRMGFTRAQDPVKVEQELMQITPKQDWSLLAHLFIDHGRKTCTARRAYCDRCPIQELCPQIGIGSTG